MTHQPSPDTTTTTEIPAAKPIKAANPGKPVATKAKAAPTKALARGSNRHVIPLTQAATLHELAAEIQTLHEATTLTIRSVAEQRMQALDQAIRCGRALMTAKAIVGHGNWLNWLEENCKISHDTCARYVKLTSNFANARNITEGKSMTQAIALISETRARSAPKKEKEASETNSGQERLRLVVSCANRLAAALRGLPPEQEKEAVAALGEIRQWLSSAYVPVRATTVL